MRKSKNTYNFYIKYFNGKEFRFEVTCTERYARALFLKYVHDSNVMLTDYNNKKFIINNEK